MHAFEKKELHDLNRRIRSYSFANGLCISPLKRIENGINVSKYFQRTKLVGLTVLKRTSLIVNGFWIFLSATKRLYRAIAQPSVFFSAFSFIKWEKLVLLMQLLSFYYCMYNEIDFFQPRHGLGTFLNLKTYKFCTSFSFGRWARDTLTRSTIVPINFDTSLLWFWQCQSSTASACWTTIWIAHDFESGKFIQNEQRPFSDP